MRWSPSVTVAAVIRRGDRYLTVEEQPDDTRVLNQPAGHLEKGESLLAAVQREVVEETGFPFIAQGLVGIYQWSVPGTDRSYLRFCFVGDVDDSSSPSPLDDDIVATHWLTRAEIASGPIPPRSPMVLQCIDDAANRPPIALDYLRAIDA